MKQCLNNYLSLEFQDKNVGKLYIYYENHKLCLMIDNYNFDSNHRITRKSDLYLPMKRLLQQIKEQDVIRNFYSNRFEWVSQGYGMPEAQNRLVIYDLENIIIMNFIKSKYNTIDKQDTCLIQFDLNESKNESIINAFNDLFISLYSKTKLSKTRNLKKMVF